MTNIIFGGAVDHPDMPKGCYTLGDKVYFNVHTDRILGSRKNGTHHICKATSKKLPYYLASNSRSLSKEKSLKMNGGKYKNTRYVLIFMNRVLYFLTSLKFICSFIWNFFWIVMACNCSRNKWNSCSNFWNKKFNTPLWNSIFEPSIWIISWCLPWRLFLRSIWKFRFCLLYTSDAADE